MGPFQSFCCYLNCAARHVQLQRAFYYFAAPDVNAKFQSILYEKTYFFYFTHPFLQNTHISSSILHIYSIKYSFFYNFLLFPPWLPLSLTDQQSITTNDHSTPSHHYHYPTTITTINTTQPPSSRKTHSIPNPFNLKPINHPPNPKPNKAKSSPTQSAARSSKPTNEPEYPSRSRSKPTDPYPQSTKKLEKKKKKKNQQPTDRSEIEASSLSKIDTSQHCHLLATVAGLKLNQKWIKTHEILGDRPVREVRSCCRRRTRQATRLAQPHSHRQRWRLAEAKGRKIDEMRERESCVVRLRESESESKSRDKREKKLLKN